MFMGMVIEGPLSEDLVLMGAAEIRCRISSVSGSWSDQNSRWQDGKSDED